MIDNFIEIHIFLDKKLTLIWVEYNFNEFGTIYVQSNPFKHYAYEMMLNVFKFFCLNYSISKNCFGLWVLSKKKLYSHNAFSVLLNNSVIKIN